MAKTEVWKQSKDASAEVSGNYLRVTDKKSGASFMIKLPGMAAMGKGVRLSKEKTDEGWNDLENFDYGDETKKRVQIDHDPEWKPFNSMNDKNVTNTGYEIGGTVLPGTPPAPVGCKVRAAMWDEQSQMVCNIAFWPPGSPG